MTAQHGMPDAGQTIEYLLICSRSTSSDWLNNTVKWVPLETILLLAVTVTRGREEGSSY